MPKLIHQPSSPRAQENEFAKVMEYMVGQISNRFYNQVFSALNQSTVDKFEDKQVGNYATVFLTLSRRVQAKIRRQFSSERISEFVSAILRRADKRAQEQLYKAIEKAAGLNSLQLAAGEGLTPAINALILETGQWVEKLRDETLEQFTNNSLHAMTLSLSLEEVLEQFRDTAEKRKGHAKFLAQNQIQNFNSITSKLRVQNLGITRATWSTSGDESVRLSHDDRDGKEFELSKGLYSSIDKKYLLPGVDYRCRCVSVYILDEAV